MRVTAEQPTVAKKAVVINVKTVTAKTVKAALKKAGNERAKTVTLGAKVKTIKPRAFAGTGIRTLVLKTKGLSKKGVKNSLKGSSISTVQVKLPKASKKVLAKTRKAYRAYFTKENAGKRVTVA